MVVDISMCLNRYVLAVVWVAPSISRIAQSSGDRWASPPWRVAWPRLEASSGTSSEYAAPRVFLGRCCLCCRTNTSPPTKHATSHVCPLCRLQTVCKSARQLQRRPPIDQRCRLLSRPHASHSCRARVPRDVGKAMVLHEHDGDEQAGTYIIDVGDCVGKQLD